MWMPLESEDVYVCCFELAAQWLLTVTMKSSEAWVLPSTPPFSPDMAPFSLDMAPKLPKLTERETSSYLDSFHSQVLHAVRWCD